MLCPIQRRRCWGERRKLLWTPALYDLYYRCNRPHSPTYSIAPFAAAFAAVASHSSRRCVCSACRAWVCDGSLWWGGRLRNGGRQELRSKPWRDSSPNIEGRSNVGEWQRCRDKASCQSRASAAHHHHQPPPFFPEGTGRQDRKDPKYHVSPALDKPNICFVRRRRLHSSLSHPHCFSWRNAEVLWIWILSDTTGLLFPLLVMLKGL